MCDIIVIVKFQTSICIITQLILYCSNCFLDLYLFFKFSICFCLSSYVLFYMCIFYIKLISLKSLHSMLNLICLTCVHSDVIRQSPRKLPLKVSNTFKLHALDYTCKSRIQEMLHFSFATILAK